MAERKTEKLEFKDLKKYFENTKNTITPHLSNGSISRLNTWIKNFLEGVSFVNQNKGQKYTPFFIYGINIKNLDEKDIGVSNVLLIYENPLTKHDKKYIEECFFKKGTKLYIDLYVTFNKNAKKGKLLHLMYNKKVTK